LGAIYPKKVSKGGSKSKAIELMKADQQVLLAVLFNGWRWYHDSLSLPLFYKDHLSCFQIFSGPYLIKIHPARKR